MSRAAEKKAASLAERFALAYIAKGENATAAYREIKPHVTDKTAQVEGHRLLVNPKVQKLIAKHRAELRARFALTTDRVVQELARMAYFNPRRMLDAKGKPKKLHEIDEDTAAALTIETDGANVLRVRSVSPSAKNTAVEKAVKILRLYDKPPPPPPESLDQPAEVDRSDLARRLCFVLAEEEHRVVKKAAAPAKPSKKKISVPA